ncbi:MAG: hypothetical protein ACI9G1_004241 [Pirellulaceae bacterium]|jgi:hypothetical protein
MVSPYEVPDTTATPKRNRSFRRLAGWGFIAVSVFAGFVLLLNVIGCSLYLYVNIGSKDLIFGGGSGVSHTAIAPHTDMTALANDPMLQSLGSVPGYWHTDILKLGPLHLFAEPPGESFQPLRFDFVNDDEYMAVEFPLLILIAAFATLGGLLLRRHRAT